MNKISAGVLLLLFSSPVFAANKTSDQTKPLDNNNQPVQEYSIAGKWCVNINASLGATFPWGELKNVNSPEVKPGFAYSLGIKSWYGLFKYFAPLGGVGYSSRPITVHYKTTGNTYTFELNSIDLLAGGRGFYKNFYGEAGIFLGINPGDPKVKSNTSTQSFKKAYPDGKVKNDYGCFIGAGYCFPYSDKISFDAGMQCRFGLVHVIEIGSEKLGSTEAMISGGVNYFLY